MMAGSTEPNIAGPVFLCYMKIEGIDFRVFNTFLNARWRLERLSDDVAGKMWKALVCYFDTGVEPDFDDPVTQHIYEEFKQANIMAAKANKKKNMKRKEKQALESGI